MIYFWDAQTGESLGSPLPAECQRPTQIRFSSNGHWLACGSDDGCVRIWDVNTRKLVMAPINENNETI